MVHFRHFAIFMAALLPVIFAKPTQIQQKRDTITRKYIVTLKDSIDPDDVESHMSWVRGAYHRDLESTRGIEKTYSINTWNAYSGEFDNATIEMIKSSADVSSFWSCSATTDKLLNYETLGRRGRRGSGLHS
jgi:hypothetical protein